MKPETHTAEETNECLSNLTKFKKHCKKVQKRPNYEEYLVWCIRKKVRHMSEKSWRGRP
jgi:hypothetical protein